MNFTVLRQMLTGGAKVLIDNKEILNKINVFPIPDGDTGTNMSRTIMGMLRALNEIGDDPDQDDFEQLYNGVLMSSQGNSGVILSQWFKGFLNSIQHAQEINALSLNEAFLYAIESSYAAVVTPVEGTFLTVAREAQEMTEEELEEDTSTEDFLKSFVENAKTSLSATPEKLPVLKEAGVVDSGGMGFVFFVSGMLSALDGSYVYDPSEFDDLYADGILRNGSSSDEAVDLKKFGYCTEVILQLDPEKEKDFSVKKATGYLEQIGNSIVTVQNQKQVKVHVHTEKPEEVLSWFHQFGEFRKLKIENMSLQHHEMYTAARKESAVVAVVNGKGIADTFSSMGADVIVKRSADKELSVGEISKAVNEANAEKVILLVDDKNLHLIAVGVKEACPDVKVFDIDSESSSDVYAALSLLEPDSPLEKLVSSMQEAVKENVTLVIKQSEEVSDYHHLDIHPGDYIASVNGTYTSNSPDLSAVLEEALSMVSDAGERESVMVFCRDQNDLADIQKLEGLITRKMPSAEVFMLEGGQEENRFLFSIQ